MAKKTEEYYICNRCNIKIKRPMVRCDKGPTVYKLTARAEDARLASWVTLNWTDLCCSCNFHLENLVKDEQKKQRETGAKL